MKDVARLAGVSLGTVSNVINNKAGVKAANQEKVQEAMRQLQFVPNMTAQQLRSNQSSVIGLILPTITNPYYSEVAQSVSNEAGANGMSTLLCVTNRSVEEEIRIFSELVSRRVLGIIAVKSALPPDQLEEYSKQVRIVLIDCMPAAELYVDVVNTTNYDAVADAVRYVNGLGHTKIAYMAGDMVFQSAVQRMEGFRSGMKASRLAVSEESISVGDYSRESGYQRGKELLRAVSRPTAVICANEMMAGGLYQAAEELGLRIPEDLSVVGGDNTMLAGIISPKLTTIDQMSDQQGKTAVKLLLKRLRGDFSEMARTYILQTSLVMNQSCARPD